MAVTNSTELLVYKSAMPKKSRSATKRSDIRLWLKHIAHQNLYNYDAKQEGCFFIHNRPVNDSHKNKMVCHLVAFYP